MKVFEQLIAEGLLTSDQAGSLQEAIQAKVQMEVDVIIESRINEAQKEWEAKANDFLKEQYSAAHKKLADKDLVIESLQEEISKKEASISEKLEKLEESTLSNLDMYLDQLTVKKINQDLLESVAQKETYKAIVESIMSVLSEKLPAIDTTHSVQLESLNHELAKAKADKDSLGLLLKESHEKTDALKKGLLVVSESRGLTDQESEKMYKFFESKSFEETKGLIKEYKETLQRKSTASLRDEFKKEQKTTTKEARQLAENKTATEVSLDESRSIEKVIEQTKPKKQVEMSSDFGGINISQLDALIDN